MSDLLPPNSTGLERAIALAFSEPLDMPLPMRSLWNPDTCPVAFLPYLAWAYSMDYWDSAWPEWRQREAVKDALLVHRRKGTVWSVKRVIQQYGYDLLRLIEHAAPVRWDGTAQWNGWFMWGDKMGWAMYRVIINSPRITDRKLKDLIMAIGETAPVRCLLLKIHTLAQPVQWNGRARWDGSFQWGVTIS